MTEAVEGRWFGVLRAAAQAFIESSTNWVNGTVVWTLSGRAVDTVSVRAQDPLYLRDREAWEMESVQTEKDGHSVRSEERTFAGLSSA